MLLFLMTIEDDEKGAIKQATVFRKLIITGRYMNGLPEIILATNAKDHCEFHGSSVEYHTSTYLILYSKMHIIY